MKEAIPFPRRAGTPHPTWDRG